MGAGRAAKENWSEDSILDYLIADPCGPCNPTFALAQLENLGFFDTNHLLGTLDFTDSEH